ncbi:MAG: DUF3352 domain-containing protein [Actinomycetota bacterium]
MSDDRDNESFPTGDDESPSYELHHDLTHEEQTQHEGAGELFGGSSPPPPRRIGRVTLALVLVILAGIGAGVGVLLTSVKAGKSLDQLIPADAAVYVSVHAHPRGEQADALDALKARLSPAQRTQVSSAIDNALQSIVEDGLSGSFFASRASLGRFAQPVPSLSWKSDFEPWLGDNVAVAVSAGASRPAIVLLADVKDEGKARSTLDRVKERVGASQFSYSILDGVAYISTSDGYISSLRTRAQSNPISGDSTFQRDRDRVQGSDSLVLAWVNSSQLGSALSSLPGTGSIVAATLQDATLSVRVESQGIALNATTKLPPGFQLGSGTPRLVESAPANQVAALTAFDLGDTIDDLMRLLSQTSGGRTQGSALGTVQVIQQLIGIDLQRDLTPWLRGEFSVVFGGISAGGPEFGIVIDPTDKAAAGRTLTALREHLPRLASQFGFPVRVTPGPLPNSFTIEIAGFPLLVTRGADRVVISSSLPYARRLLHASETTLGADALYRAAMGGSSQKVQSQLYVRLDKLRQLIEISMDPERVADYNKNVKPILQLFEAFGMRTTIDGDTSRTHALLTLASK